MDTTEYGKQSRTGQKFRIVPLRNVFYHTSRILPLVPPLFTEMLLSAIIWQSGTAAGWWMLRAFLWAAKKIRQEKRFVYLNLAQNAGAAAACGVTQWTTFWHFNASWCVSGAGLSAWGLRNTMTAGYWQFMFPHICICHHFGGKCNSPPTPCFPGFISSFEQCVTLMWVSCFVLRLSFSYC